MEKQNLYPLTQGEKLMIFIFRFRKSHGKSQSEVAKMLGVEPESIPRMYYYKKLRMEIIDAASAAFSVPTSVFTDELNTSELMQRIDALERAGEKQKEINREQAVINSALVLRIRELEAENDVLKSKQN